MREALEAARVAIHPFVAGELACGNLPRRRATLDLLGRLPEVTVASHDEAVTLLESRRLFGRGLGWVDVHLLTSALLSRCPLWTLDRPLRNVAVDLRIAFSEAEPAV